MLRDPGKWTCRREWRITSANTSPYHPDQIGLSSDSESIHQTAALSANTSVYVAGLPRTVIQLTLKMEGEAVIGKGKGVIGDR
jgi:hypothetical protein